LIDEKTAKKFEKYMRKYMHLYEKLARIIDDNLPKNKKPVIVDIGVGPGLLSKSINKITPDSTVIGVDPSPSMLNIAKQNAKITAKKGTSEKIPIEDKSADAVVTRFTLVYWDDPQKSFKEINRVLKSNGIIVIEALNKEFSRIKLLGIRFHMILNNSGFNIAKYHIDAYDNAYDLKNVEELLKNTGFKITYKEAKEKDWNFIIVAKKQ